MVYKKYVYKNGNRHGPYYYHSYREDGKVKKKYIGGREEYLQWKSKNKSFHWSRFFKFSFMISLFFLFSFFFFSVNHISPTGFVVDSGYGSSLNPFGEAIQSVFLFLPTNNSLSESSLPVALPSILSSFASSSSWNSEDMVVLTHHTLHTDYFSFATPIEDSPLTTLISPKNGLLTASLLNNFVANFTDNNALRDATLYIWNSSGSLVNQSSEDISGVSNQSNLSIVLDCHSVCNFTWNYLPCDTVGNCYFTSDNFSITVDTDAPIMDLDYPLNGNYYNYSVANLSYGVSDYSLYSCWHSVDEGVTNSSSVPAGVNFTGLFSTEGWNNWTLYCNDTVGNMNSTLVSFFIDTIPPLVKIQSPMDNYETPNTSIGFNVSIFDANLKNVSWIWDGVEYPCNESASAISVGQNYECNYSAGIRNITLLRLSADSWELDVNESNLNVPSTYVYSAKAYDIVNFSNQTSNRTAMVSFDTLLNIYDLENDSENEYAWFKSEQELLPNQQEYFFVNYTTIDGAYIPGASCNITISGNGVLDNQNMIENSSAELFYYNRSFQHSGNYSWNVTCKKYGDLIQHGVSETRVRIVLENQTSIGAITEKNTVNYNENVLLNVTVPSAYINAANTSYLIDSVWAQVDKPDSTSENVSLFGSATGGIWNGNFTNTSVLGTHDVTYFANLTNGFDVVKLVYSNFSVENTSIIINKNSLSVNTTEELGVSGIIRRTNSTDFWNIVNNNFMINLNNVTVSSDVYNDNSTFLNGTSENLNVSSNIKLNLSSESGVDSFSDNYSDDPSGGPNNDNVYSSKSIGYDPSRNYIFSWNNMNNSVGEIVYKFSSVTKFYDANISVTTGDSETNGGASVSLWVSTDGISYNWLNSTTSEDSLMSGNADVNMAKDLYVKVMVDTYGLSAETPVSKIEVNYTNYDYAPIGNFTSDVIALPNITYTVLRWDEIPNNEGIKVQIRESSNGASWGPWSENYTNNLNNDISYLSENYVQYRAWLTTSNLSISPVLKNVAVWYFNALTNSSGGYAYNITIPTDSLGVLPLEVSVIKNPETGIVGTNSTSVEVWAKTNVSYDIKKDYNSESNYSVSVNFSRADTGELVNGTIDVVVYNDSQSWSQECSGESSCVFSWLIPTDIGYGNYSINVSANNESAYYRNTSVVSYNDYLEKSNTTADVTTPYVVIGDYNPLYSYDVYTNVTINNTGGAAIRNAHVDSVFMDGGIQSVTEVSPAETIWPGEAKNATMRIVLTSGLGPGMYQITWETTWENNDGTIAIGSGPLLGANYVNITGNATMAITNHSVSKTVQHDSSGDFDFDVESVATSMIVNISVNFSEGNITEDSEAIPESWMSFSPSHVSGLAGGESRTITTNITVPAQTSPGNYTGTINVSSSAGLEQINLTVEVPLNTSWYFLPSTNLTYNYSHSLNARGNIGNWTVYNTGNVNMNFTVGYSPSSDADTSYTIFNYQGSNTLFQENDNVTVDGLIANPTSVFVAKGGNSTIQLWHKAKGTPLNDVAIDIEFSNSSATPSSGIVKDSFTIAEQPPKVTNVWFFVDGVNGSVAERNKNLTIKIRATDDYRLDEDSTKVNVTIGETTHQLNASSLCDVFGECDRGINPTIANYSANFIPVYNGKYHVVATVYDQSGNPATSDTFYFTAYGKATINVQANTSLINVSNVDWAHPATKEINFTINNTGFVEGYSPVLSFAHSSYLNISDYSFSNLSVGALLSHVLEINVSKATPPGDYVVNATLTWRDPDNGYSSDRMAFTVRVLPNKSFSLLPSSLNYIVPSGGSDSERLIINNTGNDILTLMNIVCQSGDACDFLTLIPGASNFNIPAGETRSIDLVLSAPAGLTGGSYSGIFNVLEKDISDTFNVYIDVPEEKTWNATPIYFKGMKGVGQSGILGEVAINNTGNVNLDFDVLSENESMIQTNVSSISVPKASSRSFKIRYTNPDSEGNYITNVSISNALADPTSKNVVINMSVTRINITSIIPTAENKMTNVTAGENITILVDANYFGESITYVSSWDVLVGGAECENISYSYGGSYWTIKCLAPEITDGQTYDLSLALTHPLYGYSDKTFPDSIVYRDVTPPQFDINRNNIKLGKSINISANITDNVAVDDVWGKMVYPNSSEVNLTLDSSGGLYSNNSILSDVPGEYLVNYSANDTTGNLNSTEDWFEVYDNYSWGVNLRNYDNQPVSNANITFFRPNTSYILLNNISNSNGDANFEVNRRFYDILVNLSNDVIKLKNVNFSDAYKNNITLNFHTMNGGALTDITPLYRPFIGLVSNSTGFENTQAVVNFSYVGQGYDSPIKLAIISCSDWDYARRACNGSWSTLNSTRNVDTKILTAKNATGFEAYFLAENRCGNGACEGTYGETIDTCPGDCIILKEVPPKSTSSGGGGGGGGGRSTGLTVADLEKIKKIVQSFIDIGGVRVGTTSIYKELYPGDEATVRMKLGNTLGVPSELFLSTTGDAKQFVFFENSVLTLNPGEQREVLIKLVAPKFINAGDYDGEIVIKSGKESGTVPITVKIMYPEGKLLDVKIQPLTPTVAPGGTLRLQTDLLNLGKTKRVDVQFNLQLIDVNTGKIVTQKEEAFAVETSTSKVKNLTIPEDTPVGKYMVKGTAYYSNKEVDSKMQASSITYVQVQYSFFVRKFFGFPMWGWLLILLLIGGVAGGYYYLRWIDYRKKRFKVSVDATKLPPATKHSGFVGVVAETGIRAFVDLDKLQMHTLIAGSTGSGKTVAAQDIVEEALSHNKSVVVFDPTAQWTGFLRKCEDKGMLKRYKYYGMKQNNAKAFSGNIKTITNPYEMVDLKKYMDRPGEITIFDLSRLTPKDIDLVVASTVEQVFKSNPAESKNMKTLLVYDEVHRLLPKFGGSGQGFVQLERGAREFRKWGIGLFLISQVLSDFVGEIKANIGTEIQMGTRYEGDLERVNMKYGEDVLKSVVKEPIGTGMMVNAAYNSGKPYFVSFRPLLHSTKRLSLEELKKYAKYFEQLEDLDYQIVQLKNSNVDTMDLDLELKLSKAKVKSGKFQMADMYLDSLNPKVEAQWKRLGKTPIHLQKKIIDRNEVSQGIDKAKEERAKYIKKNPQRVISFEQEIINLKNKIEEIKKKGGDTSRVEIKLESLSNRIKLYKGKVPEGDAAGIKQEVVAISKDIANIQLKKR